MSVYKSCTYREPRATMTEQEYIAQGDASWREQDWRQCLNSYNEAIRLNPHSEAVVKKEMVNNIINFFNKDMLNP